jgi:hypothetical protein
MAIARESPIHAETTVYPLAQTNQALDDLRRGALQGSAVVTIG